MRTARLRPINYIILALLLLLWLECHLSSQRLSNQRSPAVFSSMDRLDSHPDAYPVTYPVPDPDEIPQHPYQFRSDLARGPAHLEAVVRDFRQAATTVVKQPRPGPRKQ